MGVTAADQGHAARAAGPADIAEEAAHTDRALAAALRADRDRPARARTGRPARASPSAMAEAVTVLWTRFLAFDSADPLWPDRDRVVLALEDGPALARRPATPDRGGAAAERRRDLWQGGGHGPHSGAWARQRGGARAWPSVSSPPASGARWSTIAPGWSPRPKR
ncbi:MAG: hypothetical protein RML45_00705 [Acetobacteraceae bacterium]|nr:hypothetical protein [Acetobacteraceae bacterium]